MQIVGLSMVSKSQAKIAGPMFRLPCCGSPEGFTVIEVLVAMCIFAIAVLGLAIGATSVMRANQTGLYTTIATNLAQDRLEELKSRTAANINTTGSPESVTASGVPVTFNRSWTVTSNCNSVAGLLCIDVTVSWTDYISHSVKVSSAVKQ